MLGLWYSDFVLFYLNDYFTEGCFEFLSVQYVESEKGIRWFSAAVKVQRKINQMQQRV